MYVIILVVVYTLHVHPRDLPIEKGMKFSLFRNLPFSSRKWAGLNSYGLRYSFLSSRIGFNIGSTITPCHRRKHKNLNIKQNWNHFSVLSTLPWSLNVMLHLMWIIIEINGSKISILLLHLIFLLDFWLKYDLDSTNIYYLPLVWDILLLWCLCWQLSVEWRQEHLRTSESHAPPRRCTADVPCLPSMADVSVQSPDRSQNGLSLQKVNVQSRWTCIYTSA